MQDKLDFTQDVTSTIGKTLLMKPGDSFYLESAKQGLYVKEGSLKLFLTDSKKSKGKINRFFLCDIEQGEYFFGIGEETKGPHFFVTTSVQTSLLQFDNNSIFTKKKFHDYLPDSLKLNHGWITKLNNVLFNNPQPKQKHIIIKDEGFEISEGTILKPKTGEIIAIESLSGKWKYRSEDIECSNIPFLLTEGMWLETLEEKSGYKKVNNVSSLKGELCFTLIYNSGKYLRTYSKTALKDQIQIDKQRLKNKSDSGKEEFSNSLINLSNILKTDSEPIVTESHVHPLIECVSLMAKESHFTINVKLDKLDLNQKSTDLLKDIAKSCRFRVRQVLLRDNWWEQDNGPLLIFLEGEEHPAVLFQEKVDSYKIFDPISKKVQSLTQDIINGIKPIAYSFIRPFKDTALSAFEVWKFGIQGLTAEYSRIIVLAISIQLLGLAIPVFTGQFMDSIIPQADRIQWIHVTVILIVAGICSALFNLVQGIAMLRLESRMNVAVQSATIDRVLKLPMAFFRKYTVGDLADRLLGVNEIRQLIGGVTFKSVLSGITGVLSFSLLLYYSPKLSLIAIGFSLIAAIINITLSRKALGYNRKIFFIRGKISGQLLQLLNGITRLHVSATESKAFSIWSKLFTKQKKWDFKAKQIENFIALSQSVYPILSTLMIFTAYMFWLLPGGETLTIGSFIAFTAAFSSFLTGNLTMAMAIVESLEIIPLYERVKPIFDSEPEISAHSINPGELTGNIEFSNVSFRYNEDSPYIMDSVSLSLKPQEYVAFVGPSGSGKSTVFRLLLGFEKPESGSIYFDEKDLEKLDIEKVRSQIGVVLQTSQLIQGSIFDNIVGSSNRYNLDDAWDAVELAGLKKDIKAMPMGMHTIVNQGGTTFSGGQRQRLMIARAIISRPRIILFDEATSALDNKTQEIVKNSIDSISATKIVIAHRLSTILNADRIMVIANGGIAQQGTYDDLISQDGLFADLAKRQLL